MEAVLHLLKDPATQTMALWLLVLLQTLSHLNQRRLFARQDDQQKELSELRGAHETAERLSGCPMSGLREKLDHCPLLHPGGETCRAATDAN